MPADTNEINQPKEAVTENPWDALRKFTNARIALGRAGVSLPTKQLLDFQLAHARAQDAVHTQLDTEFILNEISKQYWPLAETFLLHSRAINRQSYLLRPDLGRLLSTESREKLQSSVVQNQESSRADLVIVLADGLSATALEKNAIAFLRELLPLLWQSKPTWQIAPLCIVQQGRVAVGDQVAEILNAKCLVLLVGERPGLSSPDSMGLYLTWAPKTGLADSKRNCISNIRPEGINSQQAAMKAHYLLTEARSKQLSGVNLKDRSSHSLGSDHENIAVLPNHI